MVVVGATRIETSVAGRAFEITSHVFGNGQLPTANPAEDGGCVPFSRGPHRCRVVHTLGMAFDTRIPAFAAVETDCDDVVFALPVSAPGKAVHTNAVNEFGVDGSGFTMHQNLRTKMAMKIVIGMLNHGFSCGVGFSR